MTEVLQPLLGDDAFLADVEAASREPGSLHAWWLGQSGFLVAWSGAHLLLDPYLSDSLTRKYEGTDKPHVRLTRRVVDPARLGFVSTVTSSHIHTDHLDRDTILPILAARPDLRIVVPEANRSFAADRLGLAPGRLDVLDDGGVLEALPFCLTGVASAHEEVERDAAGHVRHLGLLIDAGPFSLYHPGDTVLYAGLPERLRAHGVDLAFLPINGRDPARGVPGNLDGREAAALARGAGVRLVVPCHYAMFAFNTVSPEPFVEMARALGQPYRVLQAGERVTLRPGAPVS